MKIDHLYLYHFRNYEEIELTFHPTINIFIGHNAQGKTNLLESIYLLSLAKSFKTNVIKDMIHFEDNYARVLAYVSVNQKRKKLEFFLSKEGKKAKVDQIEMTKTSDFIGILNAVIFTPEDLYLIKGSPKERRHFLDIEMSKIYPIYLFHLNQYYKLLKERNQYLKILNQRKQINDDYLDILDEQMASLQKDIILKRIKFIHQLNSYIEQTYKSISLSQEKIEIKYKTFVQEESYLYEEILKQFKENHEKDIRYQNTHVGIHRDDLIFLLDGKMADAFASQGQQRSIVLAVKIALLDLIKENIGEYPILLLDDVLSELDDIRKNQLLNLIDSKIQTFMTTTSIDGLEHDVIKKANKYWIEKGSVKEDYKWTN